MAHNSGRARNARINQAITHASALLNCLIEIKNYPKHTPIENKEAWVEGRDALDQLIQCFHEANAYNNALREEVQ